MEDTIEYQLRFLVMPDYIYKNNKLTDISRRVYAFIHTYKGRYGFNFSNENMANMFLCTPQSISNAVKQLEDLGYISATYKVKAGGGKTRLLKDLYVDYKPTYSQTINPVIVEGDNSQIPTITPFIDKVYKDNNIKGDNYYRINNNTDSTDSEETETEVDFHKNTPSGKGELKDSERKNTYTGFGTNKRYGNEPRKNKEQKERKKVRRGGGIDATHIL